MYINLRAWLIFATSLALVVVTGCETGAGDPSRAPDTEAGDNVTIHMMHLWPEAGAASQFRIVNKIIDEYEADNPHVNIKVDVFENEQYKAKMKVLSTVNELPDVGLTWAAGYLQPFVAGKLFAPLDELLQGELQHAFVAEATEAYKIEGKTYALPLEFNIAPIYYNKEIFARYGLQVPTNYDEFLHIVATLASHRIEPIALGNRDRWTGSLWYMYLADRIAGTVTLNDAIKGNSSFTDPGLIAAAQYVQDLVDRNAFNKGFNGLSNDESKAQYLNGNAAMYLMGTWELPNYTLNPSIPQSIRDNIGFFRFPAVAGGKGQIDSWIGGPGVGLFVAEDSPVKDEAKKFVQSFVKRWGEEAVKDAGVIPATKVNTSNTQLPQLYIDLLNEVNGASSMTLFADIQLPPNAAEVHLNRIQALFGKQITPEQFASAHDVAIQAGN